MGQQSFSDMEYSLQKRTIKRKSFWMLLNRLDILGARANLAILAIAGRQLRQA